VVAVLELDVDVRPIVRGRLALPLEPACTLVLFGPSGSGKTTLLRAVAGLERRARGTIRCGGEVWLDSASAIAVPPARRRLGFLPQGDSLFPHLDVAGNVAYGLDRLPRPARERRVADLLALLRVADVSRRRPGVLSGGERQRVALARTLAPSPRLLLLDEPLSAVDGPTRDALQDELRALLVAEQIPSIVVTHDRREALALGDLLAVVVDGAVRQIGPVDEVFSRPAGPEVARVVGVETVAAGRVVAQGDGVVTVEVAGARLTSATVLPSGDVLVAIRAEDVLLVAGEAHGLSARNRLPARIVALRHEGPLVRVTLDAGFPLVALVTRPAREELGLVEGASVTAYVKAPAVHLIRR